MATCNPQTLLDSANCFDCLSDLQLEQVQVQMLCDLVNEGLAGGPFVRISGDDMTGSLGIGVSRLNQLDVNGNVAIGNAYAGVSNAPANGMIIQGYLGIGTASPLRPLYVSGSTYISSHASIGSTAGNNSSRILELRESFSNSTGGYYGLFTKPTLTMSNTGAAVVIGANYEAVLTLNGFNNSGDNYCNTNTFTVTGIGTANRVTLLHVGLVAQSSSVTTELRSIFVNQPSISGGATIGTIYGCYINQQKIAGVTTGYGLYASGANDINYLNGTLGLGTIVPKSKVDIVGNITVGATYGGANAAPTSGAIIEGQVGVGTNSPDADAILDLVSTTKAFLPPRMTEVQRDAIPTPTAGMVVYNSTTNLLNFYNGAAWGAV